MNDVFVREQAAVLQKRLEEPRQFIQMVVGPRQTGKTTLVRQVAERLDIHTSYASADEPTLQGDGWIEEQWTTARLRAARQSEPGARQGSAVLILDEIQKVSSWSETVKRLWDEDTARGLDVRVVLTGSSPLLLQRGLSESMAGRFEIIRVPHWSFMEMQQAFGWDLDTYVFHGGYPGSAALIDDMDRWKRYVLDSLVETIISRDLLLATRVDKPALLRRLFELSCSYSGQILSYTKMMGQLQDVGNTTTLAHYLDLLSHAGMVTGLDKYAGQTVRRRASSPKLQVLNTALMGAQTRYGSVQAARTDAVAWGRMVESCVGAHLLNGLAGTSAAVYYWRDRDREVDFVVESGTGVIGIEVKSAGGGAGGGRTASTTTGGTGAFVSAFTGAHVLLVGGSGMPLDEFLATSPVHILKTLTGK